jgi:D-sedoheptulose 7-phosphate isomerase
MKVSMMGNQEVARQYLNDLNGLLDGFDTEAFDRIVNSILDAYSDETAIFIMGNGGSASTASHFACDINKGCCLDLDKKFKIICLNDNIPTLLAYANDLDYASVFVEPLRNFFRSGDLVIGISGSGDSENVLRAIRYASENGGKTVGLTGYSGGKLGQLVDIAYIAASDDMQKIEDVHMIIVHMIMQAVHGALHDTVD